MVNEAPVVQGRFADWGKTKLFGEYQLAGCERLFDFEPETATTLAAGAARQPGPGVDGTWADARFQSLKRRAGVKLSSERFEAAWSRGAQLSIDSLVRLARALTDEIFPSRIGTQ
jgi:hypothetical protein